MLAPAKPLVLCVEDEPAHAKLIERAFRRQEQTFELQIAYTIADARRSIAQRPPQLVLADYLLPDGRGVDLVESRGDPDDFPVIIITSQGNEGIAVESMKKGAMDYVVKSETTFQEMPAIAERTLREWNLIVERRQMQRLLSGMINRLPEQIIVLDRDGKILFINQGLQITEKCGQVFSSELSKGSNIFEIKEISEIDDFGNKKLCFSAILKKSIRSVMQSNIDSYKEEFQIDTPECQIWLDYSVFHLEKTGDAAMMVTLSDITERKQRELDDRNQAVHKARLEMLSPREKTVVEKVAKGVPNKTIAAQLDLSERTVEKHRATAMKKLGARSVADVIRVVLGAS